VRRDVGAAEILAGATRRRLSLGGSGIEIALLEWGGAGPLVLLHHANGFCKGVWGLVAHALRTHARVVAMDARGHGDSSKPEAPDAYAWDHFAEDLVEVAASLARKHADGRVALGVGHSFGGTAMLGAAARRPDLFARLLLVDPVTPPPPHAVLPPERAAFTRRLADGARRRRGTWPSRADARAHLGRRSLFAHADPRALDLYVLDGLDERPDGSVALKCAGRTEALVFERNRTVDVFALAPRVAAPTRLLWAMRGDFPRVVYETIAASMPNARVETVEAGHLVPLERPDLVVDAIRRMLASA
jgi:pimeloyl-ACP methyl ester carboxylesterase